MKELKEIIILPFRKTLDEWRQTNPVLREKELACVLTPRGKCKWKIGDGKRPFNKLRYTNKISDIQEVIIYDSTMGASTTPSYIIVRNTKVYFNPNKCENPYPKPYEYNSENK